MEENSNRPLSIDLTSVAKAYAGALSKRLEALPLDRYFFVLVLLDTPKLGRPVTQQKLCEQLNTDKASLVRVLDYLSDREYIERTVNPDDRREHFVVLTNKGKQLIPEIQKGIRETNTEVFRNFTDAEQRQFYCLLYKMCENLSALPAHIVEIELKKITKSDSSA